MKIAGGVHCQPTKCALIYHPLLINIEGYCTHGEYRSCHLQMSLAVLQSKQRLLMSLAVLQSRQSLLVLGSETKIRRLGYVIIVPVICARQSPGCHHKHWPIGIGEAASIPDIKICRWLLRVSWASAK